MKKKFATVLAGAALISLLASCGLQKADYNVSVNHRDFIDTKETLCVNTFNDYVISDYEIIKNDDGSYTIIVTASQTPTDRG